MITTAETVHMHMALNVRDIERSVDFYTSFLGQAPKKLRRTTRNSRSGTRGSSCHSISCRSWLAATRSHTSDCG